MRGRSGAVGCPWLSTDPWAAPAARPRVTGWLEGPLGGGPPRPDQPEVLEYLFADEKAGEDQHHADQLAKEEGPGDTEPVPPAGAAGPDPSGWDQQGGRYP